jgi:hypothetical protein
VPIRRIADRTFRGDVPIGPRKGLFRVRPLEDSLLFPETGLYREEDEAKQFGSNEGLLRRISEYTGGRLNPQPPQVFDAAGRSVPGTMRLWPGLLAIAILFNLVELTLRKWDGIAATLFRRA